MIRNRLTSSLLALATLTALAAPAAAARATPPQGQPAVLTKTGETATVALAPDDAWIVGRADPAHGPRETFAEHWDGSTWTDTATVSPGDRYSDLHDVSAATSDDVWAVGEYRDQVGQDRLLAEHWDGKSWTQTPLHQPSLRDAAHLQSVVAIAPDDAWAVGEAERSSRPGVVEHWDGTSWTRVTDVPITSSTQVSSVTASGAADVWIGGRTSTGNGERPFTAHWDGSTWTQTAMAPNGSGFASVNGLAAVSPTDVFAVGAAFNGINDVTHAWHWDGISWTTAKLPHLTTTDAQLESVTATASGDAWAVGETRPAEDTTRLIEHWDGSHWHRVSAPEPKQADSLISVSADATNDAWAISGDYWGCKAIQFNGRRWTEADTSCS